MAVPPLLLAKVGMLASFGTALQVIAQTGADGQIIEWGQVGGLGLVGIAFVLLMKGIVTGQIAHVRQKEREDELAAIATRALERERVHEQFMSAAVESLRRRDTNT